MKKVKLEKGDPYTVNAVAAEKAAVLVNKGEEKQASYKVKIREDIALPLKKGDKIGTLTVYCGKEKQGSCALLADRDVEKVSFITYYIRKIKNLF